MARFDAAPGSQLKPAKVRYHQVDGNLLTIGHVVSKTPPPPGSTSFHSVEVVHAGGAVAERLRCAPRIDATYPVRFHELPETGCSPAREFAAIFEVLEGMMLAKANRQSLVLWVGRPDKPELDGFAGFLGMLPFRGISVALVSANAVRYPDPFSYRTPSGVLEHDANDPARCARLPLHRRNPREDHPAITAALSTATVGCTAALALAASRRHYPHCPSRRHQPAASTSVTRPTASPRRLGHRRLLPPPLPGLAPAPRTTQSLLHPPLDSRRRTSLRPSPPQDGKMLRQCDVWAAARAQLHGTCSPPPRLSSLPQPLPLSRRLNLLGTFKTCLKDRTGSPLGTFPDLCSIGTAPRVGADRRAAAGGLHGAAPAALQDCRPSAADDHLCGRDLAEIWPIC